LVQLAERIAIRDVSRRDNGLRCTLFHQRRAPSMQTSTRTADVPPPAATSDPSGDHFLDHSPGSCMGSSSRNASMWERKKLLIWGTTYPEFSKTYYETVCTGAVDGDTGRLVRIYPITLRYMQEPFSKYDWIEADVERNTSDYRPESYKIKQDTIRVVGNIETKNDGWRERSKWVLGPNNIFASVRALQEAQERDHTSLGLVRAREVRRVYSQKKPAEARAEWEQQREDALRQRELYVDLEAKTKDLVFVPVQYRIRFVCEDRTCTTEHDLSILDWGVYVLSRKMFAQKGPVGAEHDVIAKINELLDATKRDGYLFLGNTKAHPQNFMVVGLFHPPRVLEKTRPAQTALPF
jgi:hypothetical protein